MTRRYARKSTISTWLLAIPIGLMLLFAGAGVAGWSQTVTEVEVTVEEKWQKSNGGDGQKYLVSTTEGEVFQVTDNIFFLHFRASDIYASLDPGETYTVRVSGWRIPIMSEYRNISAINDGG